MMRPIIALATLAATAAYVTAQNGVKQSSPMQGGRPTHDPTDEAVRQFEFVNQAQMADSPQPAAGLSDSQRPFRGGEVCILRDGGEECVNVNPKETVGGRSLADALTLDRRGRVWWDYARDIDDVTSRLLNVGETTLLVPIDSAVMKLARKPHQNKDGETSDDEAQKNVERFLAAHIIPDFNKHKTDGPVKTLLGKEVEIVADEAEGAFIVKPGDFKVVELSEANNGRILYINGVLPFRED